MSRKSSNILLPFRQVIKKATSLAMVLLLVLPAETPLYGQKSRKQLEKERQKQLEKIALTRKILNQTRAKQGESLAVLQTLNRQLDARKALLRNISGQLEVLESEINSKNREIRILDNELKSMRQNFSSLMYSGYKTQNSISRIGFIFSSDNFNQAVLRMAYLKRMAQHLKKELGLIEQKQHEAGLKVSELIGIKNEKSLLADQEEQQLSKVEKDLKDRSNLYEKLKSKESELKKQLSQQQKAAEKLNDAIKKAIEEEIRKEKERQRAEEERRKKATSESKENSSKTLPPGGTVNAGDLSNRFLVSKSKLPWPVKDGYISEKFGKHPHPTLSDVSTFNNGINISTTEGSLAVCVFEGEVAAIVDVPGMNRSVLIKHGDFFTVYSNINAIRVSKGSFVKAGAPIGRIVTDSKGETNLHFEIWKGYEKQNPELWISK